MIGIYREKILSSINLFSKIFILILAVVVILAIINHNHYLFPLIILLFLIILELLHIIISRMTNKKMSQKN